MRGKHSASVTAQKLRAAELKIAELLDVLTEERSAAAARDAAHAEQITALQGRLVRDVAALADERVEAVKTAAAAELRAAKRDGREQALAIALLLMQRRRTDVNDDGDLALLPEEYSEIVEVTGVPAGELMNMLGVGANRNARRTGARLALRKLAAAGYVE